MAVNTALIATITQIDLQSITGLSADLGEIAAEHFSGFRREVKVTLNPFSLPQNSLSFHDESKRNPHFEAGKIWERPSIHSLIPLQFRRILAKHRDSKPTFCSILIHQAISQFVRIVDLEQR